MSAYRIQRLDGFLRGGFFEGVTLGDGRLYEPGPGHAIHYAAHVLARPSFGDRALCWRDEEIANEVAEILREGWDLVVEVVTAAQ